MELEGTRAATRPFSPCPESETTRRARARTRRDTIPNAEKPAVLARPTHLLEATARLAVARDGVRGRAYYRRPGVRGVLARSGRASALARL